MIHCMILCIFIHHIHTVLLCLPHLWLPNCLLTWLSTYMHLQPLTYARSSLASFNISLSIEELRLCIHLPGCPLVTRPVYLSQPAVDPPVYLYLSIYLSAHPASVSSSIYSLRHAPFHLASLLSIWLFLNHFIIH